MSIFYFDFVHAFYNLYGSYFIYLHDYYFLFFICGLILFLCAHHGKHTIIIFIFIYIIIIIIIDIIITIISSILV